MDKELNYYFSPSVAETDFFNIFQIQIKPYVEHLFFVLYRTVLLNLPKLDAYFLKMFPKEYLNGMSMNDFVSKKYGKEGVELITRLTNVNHLLGNNG